MNLNKNQFEIFGEKALIILGLFFLVFSFSTAQGAEEPLKVYFFWGLGCPHCAKEKEFLNDLASKFPQIKIERHEIYFNSDNQILLEKVSEALGVRTLAVPLTVIGEKAIVGYAEGLTSIEIEEQIENCLNKNCPDPILAIINPLSEIESEEDLNSDGEGFQKETVLLENNFSAEEFSKLSTTSTPSATTSLGKLQIPFLGSFEIGGRSLLFLAVIMGSLDGFNPCAMWVLLFLISLLLGTKNRFRMWVLGLAFIVSSAFVYFVFMSAWLNLIIFLGFIFWIRILIGLVALVGGGYSFFDFYKNKSGTCKISETKNQAGVFEKLKKTVLEENLWLALGGIILLAFSVNLVELVCSAGLPAIFTQVLTLNNLSTWKYYLYILLYIFFFMLDDLFIFFVSMITLRLTGITTKYTRIARLVGGTLMLVIGILLIFRPDLLMMG